MRGGKKKCGECPKWGKGWCAHLAKNMVAGHEACDFGRRLMHNAYMKEWMRRKRENLGRTEQAIQDGKQGKKKKRKKEEGR